MRTSQIEVFNGVVSAFSRVPNESSAQQLNVRVEDGSLRARYGYKNLSSGTPQVGFTAIYGFEYLHGYDGSFAEQEEYVSFETISGSTKAWSRNVTTGAPTEITNSGTPVTLNASEWVAKTFRSDAYFINPNNSSTIYRHAIGTSTSLTAIAIPTSPSVAPTYTVSYGPGGSTPYAQLSWAGCDPTAAGEVACTGAATNTGSALNSDNTLSIRHTNSEIDSSFEVDMSDMTAGVADWTYRDLFAFTMACKTSSFDIDVASIQIEFRNNDGSPKTLIPDIKEIQQVFGLSGASGRGYAIRFGWSDKTRTDFDNVRYFKVSYRVRKASSTVANNDLIVSKPFIGGIDMTSKAAATRDRDPRGLTIGYSYYYSAPGFESGISPTLFIPDSILEGASALALTGKLGVTIELTATVSGDANVDNNRFYVLENGTDARWHRQATQSDADLTYDLRNTYVQMMRETVYEPTPFTFSNMVNMCAHKGACLWMSKGGFQNLKWSRVGDPIRHASDEDSDEDLNRGATFSLSDNFSDQPLGAVSVGRAVIIAGNLGCHYQLGDYPAQMTPPERIAGSFGVAGKYAFAPWKDDSGNEGMVYVGINGQVYFAMAGSGSNDSEGGANILLSAAIREGEQSLKSWLLDGQSSLGLTNYSTCQVEINQRDDTLTVIMGKRGLKLRRGNITGVRSWEPEEYNTGSTTGTVRYTAGSTKYGVRWMRSTGYMDEDEFNNADRQYLEGVNRDGGNPMPPGYWKTQSMSGENRRIERIYVERERMDQIARVKVYSRRREQMYQIPAFRHFARCTPDQQGFEHAFEVQISETSGRITLLKWDESKLSRRVTS